MLTARAKMLAVRAQIVEGANKIVCSVSKNAGGEKMERKKSL